MRATLSNRIYVTIALMLVGCAGAKVVQRSQAVPAEWSRPSLIVVFPFAVDPSEVALDQGITQTTSSKATGENETAAQLVLARQTADSVCRQVVDGLSAKGYKAVCAQRGVALSDSNILVVVGEFHDISEGNRLRRLVVGLGSGASTLDAGVSMYQRVDGTFHPLLAFKTHADSGVMPGAAIMAPVGIAAGSSAAAVVGMNAVAGKAKEHGSSTSSLSEKIADQIVQTMRDYFIRAGWYIG
jgi:Domain of unknown function (DUF4410)